MPKWTEEQQLAIDKENTNIIVSAGAGSGKTAVLTARVIRKLKAGINVNELLILTFTNKAAYEMKERIRKAISKDETIINQLDYIDNSYITTFDSFALSMVKKYNYLLNVSKNVKIADSSIIYLEKKKIIDSIFDEMYVNSNEDFLSLVSDFAIKDDKELKKAIFTINDKLDLKYNKRDYLEKYISNYYSSSFVDNLMNIYFEIIKNRLAKIDSLLGRLGDSVETDYILEINEILTPLLVSKNYDEAKENFVIKLPNLPKGSDEIAKNIKADISNELKKISELIRFENSEEIVRTYQSTKPYIRIIIEIIKKLDIEIEKFKSRNNFYEFTDVSKMAIKIVKENQEVSDELKSFFKEIMIDEYQDTSDLQEEFISMIENNNVYMVGDIKQSIYRFRNANPYLFKSKYDNYSLNKGGFKIDLSKNFRSREEVIDNINLVFSCLMSDDLGGADYKSTHKMLFGNKSYVENGLTDQNNNLDIFNYEYNRDLGYSKEEIEIFFIANDIKKKVDSKYKIFDKDSLILREAIYSDFAILLDKSVNFDLYKKIFEYLGIPLTKYTSTNITSEIEIVLIKNIIKLIICYRNKDYDVLFKYAFTSIARSYLFNYDDSTIFNYVVNGNYLDSSLLKIVKEISCNLDNLSLKEIIVLIIDKFNFYKKQIEVGDVRNRINRLTAIINIFDNLASIGYTIYDTYDYLDNLIEEGYKLEVKETDSLENSVKIMTIHASKGLEFPICYFASLHSEFNIRDLNDKFLYSEKYGIVSPYFKDGIGKTFVKDIVRDNYIKEEISEKIRLFYVALTRAKEKLILVTSFGEKKDELSLECSRNFLDMLNYVYDDISCYVKNFDINSIGITKDYNLIKKYNYKENIEDCDSKMVVDLLELKSSRLSKKRISKDNLDLLDEDTVSKINFGKEIHRIFEIVDFKNLNLDSFNISDFYKKRIIKFAELLDLDLALNIYKEYEFIYEKDGIFEHGIIDLIVEYEDHCKIVDYKLKNIDDDSYIKQLNSYRDYILSKINKKIDIYLFSIIDCVIKKI